MESFGNLRNTPENLQTDRSAISKSASLLVRDIPSAEADVVDGLPGFFTTPNVEQNQATETGTDNLPIAGSARNAHATREPHAGDTHGTAGIDGQSAPCWN